MRATEFVTEVFQSGKTNWKWARLGRDEARAHFVVGDREYIWDAFTHRANPKKWEIQFRLIRKPDVDPDELDLFGTTGTGNSTEVMSTAVDITRAFLKDYGLDNVEEITFNAKEDSRIGLYAKMIKRLLPGWDLHSKKDPYDGMVFTLTDRRAYDKPENKLGEASYEGNLGMMEMMKFFKVATPEEKDLMKQLLQQGKQEEAWELLQQVTGEELVGEDMSRRGFLGALGAGAMAASGVAGAKTKPAAPIQAKPVADNPKVDLLLKWAKKFITDKSELAAFMAQCAHESDNFATMEEYGTPERFARKYDIQYNPEKAKVLGNTEPGDGIKYRGRGYIQLTGKYNYQKAGEWLSKYISHPVDFVKNPDLVATPTAAALSSLWYWMTFVHPKHKNFSNTKQVTKHINPGLKGQKNREQKARDWQAALNVKPIKPGKPVKVASR